MKAPVIKASWLFFGDWAGFATPVCVFVKHRSRTILMHEQKHVEQWWRYWVIGFLPVYLYQLYKFGYYDNPLEQEARRAEIE